MRIIMPTGEALDYPAAKQLMTGTVIHHLYTDDPKTGGQWVASVSATAPVVIEGNRDAIGPIDAKAALRYVADHLEEYTDDDDRPYLRNMKVALQWYRVRDGWLPYEDQTEETGVAEDTP